MPRKKRLPAVIERDADVLEGLNEQQQIFVQAFVQGSSRKDAAVEAGYAEASANVTAWRLLQNPKIQAAVQQQVRDRFTEHAPMAVGVIRELAMNAKSPMVRLMAAQDLLDRGGFKPVEKQMTAIAGELTVKIDLG